MKARAWFSMMLILLISFTGFGITTTDLNQNSDAITISDYDVGEVSVIVIVVDKPDFNINENESNLFSQSLIFKIRSKIKETEFIEKTFEGKLLEPPLFSNHKIFNIKTSDKLKRYKYLLNYKRARDGINCSTY